MNKETSDNENKVNLSSPWDQYAKKLHYLLDPDPEVFIGLEPVYDEEKNAYIVTISSDNSNKLLALQRILKSDIMFGSVRLLVEFEFTDDTEATVEDYETAFEGNYLFVDTAEKAIPGSSVNYAVFSRDIISYFADNLQDYRGYSHEIVADVVRDLKNDDDVIVCTEV